MKIIRYVIEVATTDEVNASTMEEDLREELRDFYLTDWPATITCDLDKVVPGVSDDLDENVWSCVAARILNEDVDAAFTHPEVVKAIVEDEERIEAERVDLWTREAEK
jgi:hypothetical protein